MTISGFAAYVKQKWFNKPNTSSPLSAERLTHIEDGVKGNSDAIEKIAAAVISQITNDPDKIASMAALYSVNQAVAQLNSNFSFRIENAKVSNVILSYDKDSEGYYLRLIHDGKSVAFWRVTGVYK